MSALIPHVAVDSGCYGGGSGVQCGSYLLTLFVSNLAIFDSV